ncbi:General L-amino acid-binding periplasmic protein AapJ [Chlamydiales bacterium SCGC AB-751-O23]|nr:General L-amino acid-binding periplasmic protein AapJ [Chlamydiales bacterium SCGC AB-751-O23]
MKIKFYILCLFFISIFSSCSVQEEVKLSDDHEITGYGRTLKNVKNRGVVKCGVNSKLPGFGYLNEKGENKGFDVDFCRALSCAVFGTPDKVEYRALSSKERFTALQTGEVDVVIRNTTKTLTREIDLGINFAPVTLFDGQGMMVHKASNVKRLEDLEGATIGVHAGTTTELNLADQMAKLSLSYTPVVYETGEELFSAYDAGRVDAVTSDKSGLISRKTTLANPSDHMILDVTMSKEPLAPLIRHGDDNWFDLVSWVIYVTSAAEEYDINSENVDKVKATTNDPRVKKLLGIEGGMGEKIGLKNDWAYDVIKHVGNYNEIYERNLGEKTIFKLSREKNELYTNGGLLFAPPFR